MAYKFQLGAFTASGSLTTEGNLLAKDSVLSGSSLSIGGVALTATPAELNVLDGLAQGSILLGDGNGAAAVLDAKTSGQIMVGNGTTVTSVAISGDATLAANGALTIANDSVENSMLANIARGSIKVGGNLNAPTDLDAKTSGQILVGDGTDIASVAVSGDATLAANGALTIAANAVEGTMLHSSTVSGAINLADDKIGLTGSVAGPGLGFSGDHSHLTALEIQLDPGNGGAAQLQVGANGLSVRANIAGDGINMESNILVLDINGLSTTMTGDVADADAFAISDGTVRKKVNFSVVRDAVFNDISSDATVAAGGALTIANNAITAAKIATAVAGSGLTGGGGSALAVQVSGAINLADDKLGLTGSIAGNGLTFANAAQDGFGDHSHIEKLQVKLESANALSVSSNGIDLKGTIAGNRTFSNNVEIGGSLFVRGTTTTVNSTSIAITGSLVFEGSTADGNETTLGVVDPDAARTINLANASGTLIPFAAASTTTIAATPAELNLMDADVAIASEVTDLADGDGIIVEDGNVMKKVALSSIKTYIGNASNLDVALKDDSNTLAIGVNYFADLDSGGESCALPASPSVGDAVYLKAPSNCSSANPLTLAVQTGTHSVDGADQIVLESPHAAVMCVYVVENKWKVF
jgi:hypothetical protein